MADERAETGDTDPICTWRPNKYGSLQLRIEASLPAQVPIGLDRRLGAAARPTAHRARGPRNQAAATRCCSSLTEPEQRDSPRNRPAAAEGGSAGAHARGPFPGLEQEVGRISKHRARPAGGAQRARRHDAGTGGGPGSRPKKLQKYRAGLGLRRSARATATRAAGRWAGIFPAAALCATAP